VSPVAWAVPTPVPSYPSAAEVAAAKKKVSSKKAMIKRIEAIIVGLTDKADAAERVAQIKGEAYSIAKDAYDQKAAQVATLQSQADAAMAQANQAIRQLGQIAGQMYRSGAAGTSLTLFLNCFTNSVHQTSSLKPATLFICVRFKSRNMRSRLLTS
jgi:hypothetical protein